MVNLLYLHGFNSSPKSFKALQTCQYFAQHFPEVNVHMPQLKSAPLAAINQLEQILSSDGKPWLLMGSSLGGFFATYLAEKYQLPAVLINPAVKPYQLLTEYLGDQVNPYSHERYQVSDSFIADLKQLEQKKITKKHYLVMVQTGDEVLDYQQAVDKYQNCQIIVQKGGDHSFVDYTTMLPTIARFFQL